MNECPEDLCYTFLVQNFWFCTMYKKSSAHIFVQVFLSKTRFVQEKLCAHFGTSFFVQCTSFFVQNFLCKFWTVFVHFLDNFCTVLVSFLNTTNAVSILLQLLQTYNSNMYTMVSLSFKLGVGSQTNAKDELET